VPFRRVDVQKMHVYCIKMTTLGLVGCHFGGLASRKCMYVASEWQFGVGRVPFRRVGEQEMHVQCMRMAIRG
jgi:hypothetical protein